MPKCMDKKHVSGKLFLNMICWAQILISVYSTTMDNTKTIRKNQIAVKCEICDKQFKNVYNLNNHFNVVHNNLEKEHQCNICQKKFNIQLQL